MRSAQATGYAAVLAVKDAALAMMARAAELDERIDAAGPHRALGAWRAALPVAAGGGAAAARAHFDRARQLAPDNLLGRVAEAETYAVLVQDVALFDALLAEVARVRPGPRSRARPRERARPAARDGAARAQGAAVLIPEARVPNVLAHPRAASAVLATALALAACHPRRPPPDLSLDPGPLLAQVRAAQARVQRVSGEARVKVEAKGMRTAVAVREFIAAEKPDRLHVEVLDFFGNAGAVLAASGGRFQLYDAKERVFYRGEATPENLARLVPLPLPAEDLVTILCGSAPLLERPVDVEARGGVLVLSLEEDGRTQEVRVGEKAAVERASVVSVPPQGARAYSLDFDAFRPLTGGPLPRRGAPARR